MTVAQAKLYVAAAEELLKGDPDGPREARMAGRHGGPGCLRPCALNVGGREDRAGGGPPPERGRPQGAEEAP